MSFNSFFRDFPITLEKQTQQQSIPLLTVVEWFNRSTNKDVQPNVQIL